MSCTEILDLLFRAAALGFTAVGGAWFAVKYFADKQDARRAWERELRLKVYRGYFKTIVLQNAFSRELASGQVPKPGLPDKYFTALFQVELIAGSEVAILAIDRNATLHKSMIGLLIARQDALSKFAARTQSEANFVGSSEWRDFLKLTRADLVSSNENYRKLVAAARRDIGLPAGTDEIVQALERDLEVALKVFDSFLG